MYFEDWADRVHLTRDLVTPADRAEFYARARQGELIPLFRGAYVSAADWNASDRHGKYRSRVKAAALQSPRRLLFTHELAAALWRLPCVPAWPRRVHVRADESQRGHSGKILVSHTSEAPDHPISIEGLLVTSLARTVLDLAATRPFEHAVAVADAALRRTLHPIVEVPRTFITREDLVAELEFLPLRHGSAKARRVIEFADASADRPGESLSRVSMSIARLPPPILQASLVGASGRVYFVDFWWPNSNLIGEFDGKGKYRDPAFLRGRSPEQALQDEKAREDDLRAAGYRVSRWGWDVAMSPRLLAARLVAAGLH